MIPSKRALARIELEFTPTSYTVCTQRALIVIDLTPYQRCLDWRLVWEPRIKSGYDDMVVCFCFDLARTPTIHCCRLASNAATGSRSIRGREQRREMRMESSVGWIARLTRSINRCCGGERASKMPPPMKSELFLIASQQFRSARLVGSVGPTSLSDCAR